jgi:hypothetical protein
MITQNQAKDHANIMESEGYEYTAHVIRDLAQQVEDLQADARRYQWLRLHPAWETEAFLGGLSPEEFDAAVGDQIREI